MPGRAATERQLPAQIMNPSPVRLHVRSTIIRRRRRSSRRGWTTPRCTVEAESPPGRNRLVIWNGYTIRMMRRLGALTLVGISGVATFAGGCGTSCAGPAIESTHIAVQGKPWLAAHPGATLQACQQQARSNCVTVARNEVMADGTHLYVRDQHSRLITLRVTGRQAGAVLINVTASVRLRTHSLGGGPCGSFSEVYARVQITARGAIRTVR